MDLFIVNFQVTTSYQELHIITFLIDKSEYVSKTIRNNSSQVLVTRYTQHCMCLTTTCLPICKNSSIVSFNNRFDKRESTLIIKRFLLRISVVDCIICKIFRWSFITFFTSKKFNLILIFMDFNNLSTSHLNFLFVHWSYTNHYFYSFCTTRF